MTGPDPVLSERQRQILDFIGAYAERHGVSPSFREIGDAVGLKAISAVKYQVEQLQEKGCLTRRDRMPRTIVAKPRRLRSIAPELDGISADPGSDRHGQHAVVRVGRGRSRDVRQSGSRGHHPAAPGHGGFTEICSRSGWRATPWSARTSSTVTAWWSASNTMRSTATSWPLCSGTEARSRRSGGPRDHVWLMPENPSYDPIPGDGCRIMGKVVATLHSRRNG